MAINEERISPAGIRLSAENLPSWPLVHRQFGPAALIPEVHWVED
jgi:hypothetical protein